MKETKRYVGIHKDVNGGMTDIGKIIRDAWAFQIIPEEQNCEGWLAAGIEDLWRKVNAEWEKYGFKVANLPEETRQRYLRIQEQAIAHAKRSGWDAELEIEDD